MSVKGIEKIKARWLCRIPENFELVVKSGQIVEAGEKLAEGREGEIGEIDIGSLLGEKWWKKIKQDEALLVNKKFKKGDLVWEGGGWVSKKMWAPLDIEIVGLEEGKIRYRSEANGQGGIINSPVKAKVEEIREGGVILGFAAWEMEISSSDEKGIWGVVVTDKKFETLEEINASVDDKIIWIGGKEKVVLMAKAEALGAAATVSIGESEPGSKGKMLKVNVSTEVGEEFWKKFGPENLVKMYLNPHRKKALVVVE